MQILINNKFIKDSEARISIFSDAVMFGCGIFETLRTYKGKKIFRLKEHVSRLINSASQIDLKMNYNFDEIQNMVQKLVEESEYELQRIKILALPGLLAVLSNELKIDKNIYNGVSLKTVIHRRSIPEIKSTSYMDCMFHHNRVVSQGYYDALFIDENDFVYECTRSNIFWIKNGKIFSRQKEILPGIMRDFIVENSHLPIVFKNGYLSELLEAEEVFITNSIIGIVPVSKIDDSNVLHGKVGYETKKLMIQFEKQLTSI